MRLRHLRIEIPHLPPLPSYRITFKLLGLTVFEIDCEGRL